MPNENDPFSKFRVKDDPRVNKEPVDPFGAFRVDPPKEYKPTMSDTESALRGAGQGVTFGFSDEMMAGGKALYDRIVNDKDFADQYDQYLQKEREMLDRARNDNPLSYMGGFAGGGLATSWIPGVGWMNIGKGASAAANLGKAAMAGGLYGAGESQAKISEDPLQVGIDAAKGAGMGAASHHIIGKIAPAIKNQPEILRQKAAERAVKASTGQNISALRKIAGTTHKGAGDIKKYIEGMRRHGDDLLDEKVLTESGKKMPLLGRFDTAEKLAPKLNVAKDYYGGKIGEVAKGIDDAVPNAVNLKKPAGRILDEATEMATKGNLKSKSIAERAMKEAEDFELKGSGTGKVPFSEAQYLKGQFKHRPVDADALASDPKMTNSIRKYLKEEMDDTATGIAKTTSDPKLKDLAENYVKYKRGYGSFKNLGDAASDRVNKNLSNRFVSPSDYASGSTAALIGATQGSTVGPMVLAALGAGANKLSRERGSAFAARTLRDIAELMERTPNFAKKFGNAFLEASERGPGAMVATHAALMRVPQYSQFFEEEFK